MENRYRLDRWAFKNSTDGWQKVGTEFYNTRAEVDAAYARAKAKDGAWPDIIDTKTGEYVA